MKRKQMKHREWWSEGLNFTCLDECGKCCDEPGGIVYLSPDDAIRISSHHDLEVSKWLQRYCRRTLDGRWILNSRPKDDICIYLNRQKTCDIYEVKPTQCSAFPWWRENLRSEKSWNKTLGFCPGLTSEDAILIDGDTIRLWVDADKEAQRGFRQWPPLRKK
ncbi:MAG: YkgJ family cysteine cluster protein [Euryarchaeota archaeon]|jgi:hypothetical protein|nr:YkgJ family cysteine cluster protein [Euryarchaeota archaeon]MBT4407788.1 YkgJ family cysteine cluster protein [Euryarchaeota archaeon]